jgi:hypothetical protein
LKNKPNEGCYVCFCKKGPYYHSIPSGYGGKKELDMKCRKCGSAIGSIEKGFIQKEIAPVKREEYYRIFADDKEIEKEKSNNAKREKLKQINYMTLEQYKIKYIYKTYKKEKGVYMTLINQFKSDEKVVRNLSQLSYRLLNFILYSHLYFAFLITEKSDFNRYKPINLD